jgi:hypothetical protein
VSGYHTSRGLRNRFFKKPLLPFLAAAVFGVFPSILKEEGGHAASRYQKPQKLNNLLT